MNKQTPGHILTLLLLEVLKPDPKCNMEKSVGSYADMILKNMCFLEPTTGEYYTKKGKMTIDIDAKVTKSGKKEVIYLKDLTPK